MPRYKEDFTLYPRKTIKGKTVYYYRTYDEEGHRTSGISTGCTTKSAAGTYCNKLIKQGKLIPRQTLTFDEFTEEFWVWDKCSYILEKDNLGTAKERISREHARTVCGYTVNHIRPYFGTRKLTSIQTRDIRDFVIHLKKTTKPANGTINHILKIVKIVLGEALRRKLIHTDPTVDVNYADANQQDRAAFTLKGAFTLIHPSNIDLSWQGCLTTYTMNVLAAVTGMRRRELLGLLNDAVYPDHIHVCRTWGAVSGLKDKPKGKKNRDVPITPEVYSLLTQIMQGGSDGYVFSFDQGAQHYPENQILPRFYYVLAKMGITEEMREKRDSQTPAAAPGGLGDLPSPRRYRNA